MLADRERQADLPDAAGRIDDDDDGSIERPENGVTTKALVLVRVLPPKHATKVTMAAAAVARPMICDVVCVLVEAEKRPTRLAGFLTKPRASSLCGWVDDPGGGVCK